MTDSKKDEPWVQNITAFFMLVLMATLLGSALTTQVLWVAIASWVLFAFTAFSFVAGLAQTDDSG